MLGFVGNLVKGFVNGVVVYASELNSAALYFAFFKYIVGESNIGLML